MLYASVQNGIVLDFHDSYEAAEDRVKDEIKRDWLSIIIRKKLRKLLKKSGEVSLHHYFVYKIEEVKEIK